jgi:YidC/Oxa1 family membrane protein insertase
MDTPMKVINPEWRRLGIEPADIWMRDGVGALVRMEDIGTVNGIVSDMLDHPAKYAGKITKLMETSLFNPGHSAEVGGRYIIESLLARQRARESPEASKHSALHNNETTKGVHP